MDQKRVELARKMRADGLTYSVIGNRLGVSGTMASHYVNGYKRKVCNFRHPESRLVCQRGPNHLGVHLSSETGILIYWE